MAKFYVSSGNLQLVIEADHAGAAAIWAVHRCLSQVTPFGDEESPTKNERLSFQSVAPQRRLGGTIEISERGFGGDDTRELATLPVVAEWSRLLVAVDRLYEQL